MDSINFQVVAGILSTIIFTISNIPMLIKAARTHDLRSYSGINLALGNVGNLIHWAYIAHLPFGPIWFLHSFYTVSSVFMLFWYFRYEGGSLFSPWHGLRLAGKFAQLRLQRIPLPTVNRHDRRLSTISCRCSALAC